MVRSASFVQENAKQKPRFKVISAVFSISGLAIVAISVAIAALFWGAYDLSIADTWQLLLTSVGLTKTEISPAMSYLLWHLRLPRVILALMVGGTLAVSGAALQALFRNPLADPGLVGVTSGAMLFTVAGIVFSSQLGIIISGYLNYFSLTVLAFAGSLSTTWVVYRLATLGNKTYVATMLLAGVAIGALAGAVTGLFTYFSNEEQLRDITFWTLGSLGSANWQIVGVLSPITLGIMFVLFRHTRAMNLLDRKSVV